MRKLCLGIDLGTTNSKAAVLDYRTDEDALPEKLKIKQLGSSKNEELRNYLPSVILFDTDSKSVYVGEYARRYAVNFPDCSVRAVKRLMGKGWRHKIPGWENLWTPQGISAIILKKIYTQAITDLGDTRNDLSSVTISVPASFGSRQRQATIKAAQLAGFSGDVRLIDEPSAALIHYIHELWEMGQNFKRLTKVLVFDMGGGTLDVSLATVEPQDDHLSLQIISRSRYTELAGIEFDLRLAAYLVKKLEAGGLSLNTHRRNLERIFRASLFDLAEPLKVEMSDFLKGHNCWGAHRSDGPPFDFDPNNFKQGCTLVPSDRQLNLEGVDFEIENMDVPFSHFSQVLSPFFKPADEKDPEATGTIYGPVLKALREKDIADENIDVILLHGGMCELPLIKIGLQELFPKEVEVRHTPDAMTSVAQGAVLYHASREGHPLPIDLQEPALFESIFYETDKGFKEVVNKDSRVGETGITSVEVPQGARLVRMRFYHGFNANDPLLSYERDALMELQETTTADCSLKLRWQVNPNRTVTFTWRDPLNDTNWQEFREISAGSGQDWYPQEIYQDELRAIRQLKIK